MLKEPVCSSISQVEYLWNPSGPLTSKEMVYCFAGDIAVTPP